MKRLTTLLLVLAMTACLLAACAGDSGATTGPNSDTAPENSSSPTEPAHPVTAISDILAMSLADGEETTERYYIRAAIDSIDNPTYGAMTISDETGSIYVYGTYSEDGSIGYAEMEDKPFKGDEVLLHCTIKNYQGTMEVHNARLIELTHIEAEIDENQYTEMTIDAARDAETGTLVKVDGVVAQITYANGMIPAGVILVDETNSIYVYDGDLAAQVKIGNKITVAASKTYWILADEQANAEKFGYRGCNQLESAILLENDNGTHEFDKGWITETTVKEILDTPVTEDITTSIFKVTAIINKVPGNGFVNYYFNDLDGSTGTYAYSQCNGSDFAWLDAFDGKACTVYVVALNAKSSTADCFFRFLPVAVVDEGFVFDTNKAAEHAVKYYGVGQFQSSYTGNPALELITSVSDDTLGFKDAILSYSSSDPSVISIDTEGGKTVMNCIMTGTANITVTGSCNGIEYSESVSISVTIAQQEVTYPTVADAIAANVGDTVTVKGVVGPSLVNRSGFYLIDDTGVIAIITDADTLAALEIGHEVVLEGMRDKFHNGEGSHAGQIALTNTIVITNHYGSHDYSTNSFDGAITVNDFYNLDVTMDYSTSVYTMKAIVYLEETPYYSNLKLTNSDGSIKITLYSSSANQYNWLKAYAGQEVTVEIAPCNWNNKTFYAGCVLAVIHSDGSKTVNNLNFMN